MYNIEMQQPSDEFAACWAAAGRHLQKQVNGGGLGWLKASLTPPFLEHLSFRLGNQLFFLRVEDVDDHLETPGNPEGLFKIAEDCKGHACIMPMKKLKGEWQPVEPGWNLLHAHTGKPLDPVSLISDEKVEMTDWELQDLAVQVVRQAIEKQGHRIMSWQANPAVNPSLWFVGPNGPEWVIVRAVRYPIPDAVLPENWKDIAASCAAVSTKGNFASVSLASADDTFDPAQPPVPLWRGYGMFPRFTGLQPLR